MRFDSDIQGDGCVPADMKSTGEVHGLLKKLTLRQSAISHGRKQRQRINLASKTYLKVDDQVSTETPKRNTAMDEMIRILLTGLEASDFPDL